MNLTHPNIEMDRVREEEERVKRRIGDECMLADSYALWEENKAVWLADAWDILTGCLPCALSQWLVCLSMSRGLRHAEQMTKIHETGWRDGKRMQKDRDEKEDTQKVSKRDWDGQTQLEGGREEYRNATSMWTIYILKGKLSIKHTWICAHARLYNIIDQQSS